MPSSTPSNRRPALAAWPLFGGFSLAAVVTGCWVAHAHGVSDRALIMNMAAWVGGVLLSLLIARVRPDFQLAWPVIAFIALVASLMQPGLSGVHRWIGVGPIRLNAAELFLPAAVVGITGLSRRPWVALVLSLATIGLLTYQPDASQAAALAVGSIVALMMTGRVSAGRVAAALLLAALAAAAWLRPDPLEPVPEVEGIVRLAAGLSPAVAAFAVLTLAGSVLAPLAVIRHPAARVAGCALTAYLIVSALAPWLGAFPVPLVGMGVSPILGAWLGFGALMGSLNRPR